MGSHVMTLGWGRDVNFPLPPYTQCELHPLPVFKAELYDLKFPPLFPKQIGRPPILP